MGTASKVLDALKAHGLKQEADNRWRANSPLRPGSNSHAFVVTITDEEHGAFNDHAGNTSGSLYELAKLLNIDTPKPGEAVPTKRAYADLQEYAEAHGIGAESLKKAGWLDAADVYDGTDGQRKNRRALSFKTRGGTRYRFIDGEKPYYKSAVGYKACWYGLSSAIQIAQKKQTALILCNGEVSTVAAQEHGVPACCVTAGEKRYPPELVEELKAAWQGDIWIAMDCDQAGRKAAQEVSEQIVGSVIINLRLSDGGDLADFVMLNGEQSLENLHKLSQERPPSAPVVTDEALLAKSIQDLAQAVRGSDPRDISVMLAVAQGQIDRVSMKLAKPITDEFAALSLKMRDAIDEAAARLEAGITDDMDVLTMHIPAVDSVIKGFKPELYGILGATGIGKSWFAISMVREFLQHGPGLIVSTEMEPLRWYRRLVASIARINESDLRRAQFKSKEEIQRYKDAADWLESMGCQFLNHPSPTPAIIRAAVMDGLAQGRGFEWVVVDSASKMNFPGLTDIYGITRGVWNGLQDIHRESGLPLIATSQLGRDVADRPAGKKQPQIEDAYGGSVIEHNCGVVMGLYYHHYYVKREQEQFSELMPEGVFTVRMLKNRDEDDNVIEPIRMHFIPGCGMYELKTRMIDLKNL